MAAQSKTPKSYQDAIVNILIINLMLKNLCSKVYKIIEPDKGV